MSDIVLPRPPRRAHLRALWLVVCAAAAVVVVWVLARRAPGLVPPAAGAIALVAAGGLLRPASTLRFYRGWNRLAAALSRRVRAAGLWVAYRAVLRAAGSGDARPRLRLGRPAPDASGWTPRTTQDPAAYRRQDAPSAGPLRPVGSRAFNAGSGGIRPAEPGRIRSYLLWSRDRNAWTLGLLPVLLVLGSLETREDGAAEPDGSTYTLY